jgi:hypothetical protein
MTPRWSRSAFSSPEVPLAKVASAGVRVQSRERPHPYHYRARLSQARGRRPQPAARLDRPPNGDVITVNGGDGNAVETSPFHGQVATAALDTVAGAGSLFGITLTPSGRGLYFVDDGTNTLNRYN